MADHQPRGDDRVVFRNRLRTVALSEGWWLLLPVVAALARSWAAAVAFLALLLASVLFDTVRARTELSARGLRIRGVRTRLIPWVQVTAVEVVGSRWTTRRVQVTLVHDGAVFLPAPIASMGVGARDVAAAGEMVTGRWLAARTSAEERRGLPS